IARIEPASSAGKNSPASESPGGVAAPPRDQSAFAAPKSREPKNASPADAPAPQTKPADLRPSVRRIVEEENLVPGEITGTGPGGKVMKEDAVARAGAGAGAGAIAKKESPAPAAAPARAEVRAAEPRALAGQGFDV